MSDGRDKRSYHRAVAKRAGAVTGLKTILALGLDTKSDSSLIPKFLEYCRRAEIWWSEFLVENNAVLDALIDLDAVAEFSSSFEVEISDIYVNIMVLKSELSPAVSSGVPQVSMPPGINTSCQEGASTVILDREDASADHATGSNTERPVSSFSCRLPEIPLPTFDGDLRSWPVFSNRFSSLIDARPHLSDVEKLYYLCGSLVGEAADVVKGFSMTATNYRLTWNALVSRFDKPRHLANLLIDKMLKSPMYSTETVDVLKEFLIQFDESILLLTSMNIPSLGDFILFFLSMRCLPSSCRTLFESQSTDNFPSVNDVISFVKGRIQVLENANLATTSEQPSHSIQRNSGKYKAKSAPTEWAGRVLLAAERATPKPSVHCSVCSGSHISSSCNKFAAMPFGERQSIARKKRLCFNCLSASHWTPKCLSTTTCTLCSLKHHTLLHRDAVPVVEARGSSSASLLGSQSHGDVILGTALTHVKDSWGHFQEVRVIIDSGSQVSAITSSCVQKLGLKVSKWTVPLTGLSDMPVPSVGGVTKCTMTPRYATDPEIGVKAWVISNITNDMPRRSLHPSIKGEYSHLALADPSFDQCGPVEMLLGADMFSMVMDGKRIVVRPELPMAFGSIFGWVLIGAINQVDVLPASILLATSSSLEYLLERFWQVEEPDSPSIDITEDGQCEALVVNGMSRDEDGRYLIPLPFRQSDPAIDLQGSRRMAVKRFENLERRLMKDEKLRLAYVDFMQQYLTLGHMSQATSLGSFLIPHHAVVQQDGDNIKLRVVFDASAQSASGKSLNDCMFAGPKLQSDIVDVLLLFRTHKHVFTTDICKMYRQIKVIPSHRHVQHILWRDAPELELTEFELNTVTYGMNCAPYLRVIHDIADRAGDYPSVQIALRKHTYVDDICTGADTIHQVLQLQQDLITVLGDVGFSLKKWASNVPSVCDRVPPEDRTIKATEFSDESSNTLKLLGMVWSPGSDDFRYDNLPVDVAKTKRGVLSSIARLYDPLGLLAPVIFTAKTIMQSIWKEGCAWDDPLPRVIQDQWSTLIEELPAVSEVRVPRHIDVPEAATVHLLGFCDASIKGYAALAYLRVMKSSEQITVYYLGGKTKLAPIKTETIPRLELCAAVLLARWLARLKTILESRVKIDGIHAWTDSSVVLSWLTMPHVSFKIFVTNRIGQIRSLVPDCVWHYVPSELNPADCASRGLLPTKISSHSLYWSGPSFLTSSMSNWTSNCPPVDYEHIPELAQPPVVLTVLTEDDWFCKFSSYTRLLRTTAWMLRFVNACKRQRLNVGALSRHELDSALECLVKATQRIHFRVLKEELINRRQCSVRHLSRLSPFIDDAGVIRVGGRLKFSGLPLSQKHPILLAKSSTLTILLCRYWHIVTCHAGVKLVLAMLSRQVWIISARVVVRKTITSCVTCVRHAAPIIHPKMADLPACRVQQSRPFTHVGIDYAGPFSMKETKLRRARIYKVYLAVFVCMSVKAVHLEVVSDLSTNAFLEAFTRFASRRGSPAHVYSDCGTNFVGAASLFRRLMTSESTRVTLADATISQWHFNPPGAPHFGGIWEAAVKSAKSLLIRVMGPHVFTLEEMWTLVVRVESVLNSRPLSSLSDDPADLQCLTPGHFLIGQPLLAPPDTQPQGGPSNLRHRWTLLRQCFQSFWRQWSNEYLHTLQVRSKWGKDHPNLHLDDVVIVRCDNTPPLTWRMGRITKLLPGPDGVVRVVRVRTQAGDIVRPVVKLVLLPSQ